MSGSNPSAGGSSSSSSASSASSAAAAAGGAPSAPAVGPAVDAPAVDAPAGDAPAAAAPAPLAAAAEEPAALREAREKLTKAEADLIEAKADLAEAKAELKLYKFHKKWEKLLAGGVEAWNTGFPGADVLPHADAAVLLRPYTALRDDAERAAWLRDATQTANTASNRATAAQTEVTRCGAKVDRLEAELKARQLEARGAGAGSKRPRSDAKTAFIESCYAVAREFVRDCGPEAPWHDLESRLPHLPLGPAFARAGDPDGSSADDADEISETLAAFLTAGKNLDPQSGEVAVDAVLTMAYHFCLKFSSRASLFMNQSSNSSTAKKRPDSRFTVADFDVIRGESKASAGGLPAAHGELREKMRPWSAAYYGDAPGILGIAAGGLCFKAWYLARDGADTLLLAGRFNTAANAVKLCRIAIAATVYVHVRDKDEGWRITPQNISYNLAPETPFIGKFYKNMPPDLDGFYTDTASIDGLEHRRALLDGTVHLVPLGCSRRPHASEVRDAMRQIAATVSAVHDKGWCHRDLRWPNIVLDVTPNQRQWTVIDCEFAAKIGTEPTNSVRQKFADPMTDNTANVCVYSDYWMLGSMLMELETDDNELAEIGEQLRAVAEDGITLDEANATRKNAFERLCSLK